MDFKSLLLKKSQGFSLVELLVAVTIIGILSAVGIGYYKEATNTAKKAEAKYSLSLVYSAEKQFHSAWGTYHENLLVIGAIPYRNSHL